VSHQLDHPEKFDQSGENRFSFEPIEFTRKWNKRKRDRRER